MKKSLRMTKMVMTTELLFEDDDSNIDGFDDIND